MLSIWSTHQFYYSRSKSRMLIMAQARVCLDCKCMANLYSEHSSWQIIAPTLCLVRPSYIVLHFPFPSPSSTMFLPFFTTQTRQRKALLDMCAQNGVGLQSRGSTYVFTHDTSPIFLMCGPGRMSVYQNRFQILRMSLISLIFRVRGMDYFSVGSPCEHLRYVWVRIGRVQFFVLFSLLVPPRPRDDSLASKDWLMSPPVRAFLSGIAD